MAVIEESPGGDAPPSADALAYRLRQQSVLADFGIEALRARDLDPMLQRATELCASGMRSRYAKFLEYRPGDDRLLVRNGVGWRAGVIGQVEMGADTGSPAGYAYKTGEAVISNHLENEARFRTPAFMAEHGIRRAINVLVEADGAKYGVLEVDSPDEGEFEADDLAFMRGFANLIGVAIERQHAEGRLAAAIEHQELLTREASHRVKNSLAMVSAMLHLQANDEDDPRVERLLGDAQARITAIAQAHDKLWRGERVGEVALNDLICGIVSGLAEQTGADIACEVAAVQISADIAIPVGLVVTELATNAAKYAAADGAIRVEIVANDGELVLTVRDHGPGLPAGFDIKAASRDSLGMRMIASLVRQLGGTIVFAAADPGTVATLRFPDPRTA
ncbi:GAF domain-containing protein [Sphingomonas donggukensis]|uniref:histidine kinase n=1 Tax=Sphingomonas donggukensis TaxID=2949093 RepID=A0ABY4TW96_9SPHN|nr:histidine kinase dimerization/phosphoacceptor domain -containing protein [Sphingomonas donggukensis]URW76652.1 GAF domain-containing protein [Sphingomonas donggukensis]